MYVYIYMYIFTDIKSSPKIHCIQPICFWKSYSYTLFHQAMLDLCDSPEVCQHVNVPLQVGFVGAARGKVTEGATKAEMNHHESGMYETLSIMG